MLLLCATAATASPVEIASFDDAAGDATGPGSYVPPGDGEFTEGDFDLRRFAVYSDGDAVLFEVTLGAPIRRPSITQRTNASEIQLWNGIYLQNIDIYVDTDRASAAGYTACIPGRRVAFEPGRTWKAAVVLTPQPGPARAITEDTLGKVAAAHVYFAEGLRVSGRTVTAKVPAALFGGPPRRDWAYSVHVSGAQWERSFTVTDRLRGTREANAYTMAVLPMPEEWAFGGAPEGNVHPRVVDVLLPPGADQKAVLGSFDVSSGALARVPFVSLDTTPPLPPSTAATPKPVASGPELSVAYVAGNLISLSGPAADIKQMQFGRVLGKDGATVARVVVVQVVEGGVVV
ncbi:MAG: hypothetical protein LC689_10230, partial [Myxococcales bacterium]|nr:hypothetical protein [Myxococcales bacterium]